jgi:predicted enzyme related to lactoylglutathione lyase
MTGGVLLEIYPAGTLPATTSVRLGFCVQSVCDTIGALQALGAVILAPAKAGEWGLRAVVEDFDGHRVELVQQA